VQVTNSERAAAIAKQLAEEVKGQQGKVEAALLKQKEAAASLQQELNKATEGRKSVQAQLAAAEEKVRARTTFGKLQGAGGCVKHLSPCCKQAWLGGVTACRLERGRLASGKFHPIPYRCKDLCCLSHAGNRPGEAAGTGWPGDGGAHEPCCCAGGRGEA
jgi:hypothetical protein